MNVDDRVARYNKNHAWKINAKLSIRTLRIDCCNGVRSEMSIEHSHRRKKDEV